MPLRQRPKIEKHKMQKGGTSFGTPFSRHRRGGSKMGIPWRVVGAMLILLSGETRAKELENMSFATPFTFFNARGDRSVKFFSPEGAAVIRHGYVRITPDRPGERGSLTSQLHASLGSYDSRGDSRGSGRAEPAREEGQFSLAMKFRVSGAKEKHHGDYLAVLLGDGESFVTRRGGGKLAEDGFGFTENFVGVGVVVSSRKLNNFSPAQLAPEARTSPRQYVSIIANNGTRTSRDVRELASVCTAQMRYWEGRDDFSTLQGSRLRLKYIGGRVEVEVDSRNTGIWRKCTKSVDLQMPQGWLQKSFVGFSAGTGPMVSNNHDLISFKLFNMAMDAWDDEVVDGTISQGDDASDPGARREARIAAFRAHMEHELEEVNTKLKDSLERLDNRREKIKDRLIMIEEQAGNEVMRALEQRIAEMEMRIRDVTFPSMYAKLSGVESDLGYDMEKRMAPKVQGVTQRWRLPFALVVLGLVVVVVVVVRQYRKLVRSSGIGSRAGW
ncbi:unnamed protein product [Discosporangium mesarthrocarpum]